MRYLLILIWPWLREVLNVLVFVGAGWLIFVLWRLAIW
jgi:hypothetical protein